ncbi:MAG: hypothetical protein WC966_08795 [Bradymonadales bacterium]
MNEKICFSQERTMLRTVLNCSKSQRKDPHWEYLSIDATSFREALNEIGCADSEYIDEFTQNIQVCLLRTDPLTLRIKGFERQFSRQNIAEAIGPVGSQFFPTRQKALRCAFEAAREISYFAYGNWSEQFLDDPVAKLCSLQNAERKHSPQATILRDLREGHETDRTMLEVLQKDRYFVRDTESISDFISFQHALRSMPLDGAMVEKLSSSFNKRATIGIRDGLRWFLGSRHPWFNWERAKEHISEAFKLHGKENFNTPQIVYFTWDLDIPEEELQKRLAFNQRVAKSFAENLRKRFAKRPELLELDLPTIAMWALDIHHDYPDFDLESEGVLGAKTHMSFLSHSIQGQAKREILGEDAKMRRNIKMEAHFQANDLIRRYLNDLTSDNRIKFFEVLQEEIESYQQRGGVVVEEGIREFDRIPCSLVVFQDSGEPKVQEGERLLDSFNLSEITQLEHASYIRAYSEISEKLVVFFTLALRHMIETQHIPDLRPKNLLKDFLLLGLWGTRTEKIRIHLYVPEDSDASTTLTNKLARCEVRFVGLGQIETGELQSTRDAGRLARFAVSQFAPLIEPSILRVLATFTMALEEFRSGNRAQNLDVFSVTRYGVDIAREAMRYGVKGSLTDAATLFEFALDSSLDGVQSGIDKLQTRIEKWRKNKTKAED